ncbi:RNA-processing protein [Candidatus Geothermarchaeota archaeon ex4572_27]|nr:MAG: RNA-processing protein [Candidatus Geothermarchaeota archaeon ex4572_27]
MYEQVITLFPDRIGVLIGKGGSVKEQLERYTNTKIEVDSKTGQVRIRGENLEDVMTALNIVKAINLGFSPERAFALLDSDMNLHVIDLYEYGIKGNSSDLKRVLGRIIGEKGKARRVIEETAEVYMSVYRHYVAIIGAFDNILMAKEAIKMLIEGAPHRVVYSYLFNQRRLRKTPELWWR